MNERLQWHKFSWTAWETDDGLALCSMAAQGFWMRLLCMAAKEGGYVVLKGKKPANAENLAYLHRQSVENVEAWLKELEENEVFSRDGEGRIYSRRMMRDAKIARRNQQNGKKGGNPSLRKDKGNHPWDNLAGDDGVKAEKETESEEETDTPKPPQGAEGDLFGESDGAREDGDQGQEEADGDQAGKPYPPLFEALWSAYPHVKGRSSKAKSHGAWKKLPKPVREALPDAAKRYGAEGREPKQDCGARALERWLRDGLHEHWVGDAKEPSGLPVAPKFNGPAALRKSVVDIAGEPFAVNYIDRATWRAEDRTLIAANGFAAKQIERTLREWLISSKVRVEVAQHEGAAA